MLSSSAGSCVRWEARHADGWECEGLTVSGVNVWAFKDTCSIRRMVYQNPSGIEANQKGNFYQGARQ
jgi:hypothetical protein